MIDILILLLRPALWCADGGVWHRWVYMWPVVLIALIVDVTIAHTTWALIAGFPKKGEWTISHTLERLCKEPNTKQNLFIELSKEINSNSPNGKHIKAIINSL